MYEDENITCTPKRYALSEVTNSSSYVSPTANLKLLTNVALHYPTPPPSAAHRKEKSLQILCDRFLNLYPLHGNGTMEIQLDSTAAQLGVEKRRMYDIINILEAMQCAVHKRKNTYLWHGATRLNSFLKMLKKQGDHLRLSEALRGKAPKPPAPKHKTLGVLAQRFLMLFLVEPPNTLINLEMAVKVLIHTSTKNKTPLTTEQLDRQHKSKVRRLYDIANVFISIGLIEKVSGNLILKKPVFKYVGPGKTKKPLLLTIPSPITPLTLFDGHQRTLPCQVYAGRSKRKLEFTTPTSSKELRLSMVAAMSSKEVQVSMATPMSNNELRPSVETPMSGKELRPTVVTPMSNKNLSLSLATPPHTPSHKWDEILLVADMELTRINNGVKL